MIHGVLGGAVARKAIFLIIKTLTVEDVSKIQSVRVGADFKYLPGVFSASHCVTPKFTVSLQNFLLRSTVFFIQTASGRVEGSQPQARSAVY